MKKIILNFTAKELAEGVIIEVRAGESGGFANVDDEKHLSFAAFVALKVEEAFERGCQLPKNRTFTVPSLFSPEEWADIPFAERRHIGKALYRRSEGYWDRLGYNGYHQMQYQRVCDAPDE